MNYKLIAIDLDDTLLSKDLTISKHNSDALKQASDLGVRVVFCSGRATVSVMLYSKGYDFISHLVTYNGAVAYDIKKDEKIIEYRVDAQSAQELVTIGRQFGVSPQIYTNKGLLVEHYNSGVENYEREAGYKSIMVDDLKQYITDGSIKVLFNAPNEQLKPIYEMISGRFRKKLDIFYSKPYYLELVNIASNKGITMCALAKRLGIKPEETIAIGDSFNDLSMIKMAGLGVAMANGHPDIQKQADYVTEHDNNNSAVAEVIEKFILREQKR